MGEFLAIKCPYCGGRMQPVQRRDYKYYFKWSAFIFCTACLLRTPLTRVFDSPAEATEAAWEIAARMTFKEEQP